MRGVELFGSRECSRNLAPQEKEAAEAAASHFVGLTGAMRPSIFGLDPGVRDGRERPPLAKLPGGGDGCRRQLRLDQPGETAVGLAEWNRDEPHPLTGFHPHQYRVFAVGVGA